MEFPIKILNQLRPILRGFRKAQKLTQADIAKRLGITQQSYAQLEANPAAASLERLFKVLAILQVDVVLKEREVTHVVKPESVETADVESKEGYLVIDSYDMTQDTNPIHVPREYYSAETISPTAGQVISASSLKNIAAVTPVINPDSLKVAHIPTEQYSAKIVPQSSLEKNIAAMTQVVNSESLKAITSCVPKNMTQIADMESFKNLTSCIPTNAFDDMTNELSFAFSSLKKKR